MRFSGRLPILLSVRLRCECDFLGFVMRTVFRRAWHSLSFGLSWGGRLLCRDFPAREAICDELERGGAFVRG